MAVFKRSNRCVPIGCKWVHVILLLPMWVSCRRQVSSCKAVHPNGDRLWENSPRHVEFNGTIFCITSVKCCDYGTLPAIGANPLPLSSVEVDVGDCSVLGQRTEVEACAREGAYCASDDEENLSCFMCVWGGDLTWVSVAGVVLSCVSTGVNTNLL